MLRWDEPEMVAPSSQRTESVLVAVVPSLADWARVKDEGWYRIPLAKAPRRVGADYLAFYHPQVFGDLRWTVTYYAPVRRYRVLSRRELLPDEPSHPRADALYYCLHLGPLQALPRPIVSQRLRRVTFIHTTLDRLLSAQEINDLWLKEPRGADWERVRRVGEVTERRYLGGSPGVTPVPTLAGRQEHRPGGSGGHRCPQTRQTQPAVFHNRVA